MVSYVLVKGPFGRFFSSLLSAAAYYYSIKRASFVNMKISLLAPVVKLNVGRFGMRA